ncbi:MAG: hypothetical protein MZV70_21330 [Desulfobacterales bacterium]|nr:hypothetical protein [Desulfobacterales bacterium]
MLSARYGWDDLPDNILQELGKADHQDGARVQPPGRASPTEDDRLPEWMTKEAIPENGSVFDVSDGSARSHF